MKEEAREELDLQSSMDRLSINHHFSLFPHYSLNLNLELLRMLQGENICLPSLWVFCWVHWTVTLSSLFDFFKELAFDF